MIETHQRRSVFFELRGVLGFVVAALLIFHPSMVSPALWLLGIGFLVSDLALLMVPLSWFRHPGVAYGMFFLDMAGLTILLGSLSGIDSELLLLYYLTVFMATMGEGVRRSVGIAVVASGLHLWLHLSRGGSLLADVQTLMGIPLFFVTAVCCGYLAREARRHQQHVQALKAIQASLKGQLEHSLEGLSESERLRAVTEASERKFRNLIQDLDAIIWEAEAPTFQFTLVSQRAEDILGYPVEQWLHEPGFWAKHSDAADRERTAASCRRAIIEGRNYGLEYRTLAADGRIVWLRDRVRLAKNAQGQVQQLHGVTVDITEQKQGEAELRRVNRVVKTLSACNQAMVHAMDELDFLHEICRIIVDNGGFRLAWVGLAEQDAAKTVRPVAQAGYEDGYLATTNITWADSERGRGPTGTAIRTGQPCVARHISTDPSFAPWRSEASKRGYASAAALPLVAEEKPFGALNIYAAEPDAFDAEELKLLTELACDLAHGILTLRLRADHKRTERENAGLAAAIEQSAEGVVITDPDGIIQYVNPAFTWITGYSREEAIGQNPRLLKSGKQDPAFYSHLWQTIQAGNIWHDEIINRRKDGNLYTEEMTITPVRDERGQVAHFIAIKQDVTEHKRLEEQLRQAQKMEAVGRLAGGVAHDFNNLLTIINGYGQLLLDRIEPSDPLHEPVSEILKAGDRATSLTRQLLAFSRRQVLAPQVLDLNAIVANTNKMLRRLIGEDIGVVTALESNLGSVKVDPGQIEQVILNLAVNARDAMPQGGELTIETKNVDLDASYAGNHFPATPGQYVMLALSDTGCGMDAETQARIFEPFFTTKEKGKGTGLGLAMVYGIVKQSGGYVWVYSERGQGTTFKIYLPRVDEPAAAVALPKTHTALPLGAETVLVVEDEEAVRSLVRGILQSCGYTVLEAPDASEALRICEPPGKPIHLLLSDVVMPHMSGRELANRLKTTHPDTKVLYMSGYTDNAIVHHGVLERGTHFVQKPFTPQALARKVREVLDAQ